MPEHDDDTDTHESPADGESGEAMAAGTIEEDPDRTSAVPAATARATAAPAADSDRLLAHDDSADADADAGAGAGGWDESVEELPRRPRHRLFGAGGNGKGGNPLLLGLLGVLLIACGFIGGVLVEKGQNSSSSSPGGGAGGLAARFAALRGAVGTGASPAASGASSGGGFARSGAGSGAGAGAGATVGQVAFVSDGTLYVTNAEGNTVKVTAAPGATVTKTVQTDIKSIHPGETVLVSGAAGKNGTISAESIRVGGASGGLGGLFGAAGSSGGARKGSGSAGDGGGGGEPSLFGNG